MYSTLDSSIARLKFGQVHTRIIPEYAKALLQTIQQAIKQNEQTIWEIQNGMDEDSA
jgi:hypothetical protein